RKAHRHPGNLEGKRMNRNTSDVERRLADTLTELITQKPFAEITIKELVLTAQVGADPSVIPYTELNQFGGAL
ncbi:MAG: hypothetical protein II265_09220, partial [Clostridia bacterium]|nr:hypothetical protein [Clostridia bacterium]